MKILISGNTLIILILLVILLKSSLSSMDIAATKNRTLQREYMMKVREIKIVDSLYVEIQKQINFRNQDWEVQTKKAIMESRLLGLIMLLVILNAFLIIRKRNEKTT